MGLVRPVIVLTKPHLKSRLALQGIKNICTCFIFHTFIEPVAQAVENHTLFTSRNKTDGSVLHSGPVVDVILKYKNLEKWIETQTHCNQNLMDRPGGLGDEIYSVHGEL